MGSSNSKHNNNNDIVAKEKEEIDITKIKFEYKVPEVEFDEEGYVKAFEVDEKEEIIKHYEEYGFVVVKGVLSEEEVEETVEDVWRELQKVAGEVRREEPESWWNWPASATGISAGGLYRSPRAFLNRQAERLYRVYCYLYPSEHGALTVSLDRFGIMRPTKAILLNGQVADQPSWRGPDSWFHWDINPWLYSGVEKVKEGEKKASEEWEREAEKSFIVENNANVECEYEKFQSLIAMEDSDEESGGFQCVPGFHKQLLHWASSFPIRSRAGFVPCPKELRMEQYGVKITMRKGSLVIWSSRLPHCNYPNTSSDRWRICQYIKLFPSRVVVDPLSRRNALLQFLSLPPSQITPLGRRLFGLDDSTEVSE